MKNEILEHKLYESSMRERNIENGEFADQCICCGKRLKEDEAKFVHMNTNWMALNTKELPSNCFELYGFESQGAYPIGNSCAKKMPKIFIHH